MEPREQAPLLIVDDETDAHFFLGRTLLLAGFTNRLDIADSGDRAVAYFQECESGKRPWPAVVFLDVKMPGMNGFDVLRWLQKHGALGRTVVAMMSSSDSPKEVNEAFTMGAHTYLNKNVKAEVLGPIVKSAMRLAGAKTSENQSP